MEDLDAQTGPRRHIEVQIDRRDQQVALLPHRRQRADLLPFHREEVEQMPLEAPTQEIRRPVPLKPGVVFELLVHRPEEDKMVREGCVEEETTIAVLAHINNRLYYDDLRVA